MSQLEFELLQALKAEKLPVYLPCFKQRCVPFEMMSPEDYPQYPQSLACVYLQSTETVCTRPNNSERYWVELCLEPDPVWPLWQANFTYEFGDPFHGGHIHGEDTLVPREVWLANAQRLPEQCRRLQALYAEQPLHYELP